MKTLLLAATIAAAAPSAAQACLDVHRRDSHGVIGIVNQCDHALTVHVTSGESGSCPNWACVFDLPAHQSNLVSGDTVTIREDDK